MSDDRNAGGRSGVAAGLLGAAVLAFTTCGRVFRAIDRGSDVVRAAARVEDTTRAARQLRRAGRSVGRTPALKLQWIEGGMPGRGAGRRQLEELARFEDDLRRSGWSRTSDAVRTADLVVDAVQALETEAVAARHERSWPAPVRYRITLLQSQDADLRLAAISTATDADVDDSLLFYASRALSDPDRRVRVAAARLIGAYAEPFSIEAMSISTSVEFEEDPEVLAVLRAIDDTLTALEREWMRERRSAARK